jgi:prolyl-tRNA synthetase
MLLRMSTMLLRTLREDPADAEVPSHRLLLRAGYIRRAAPGGYVWLPLGKLVLDRVVDIVRAEITAVGGQEIAFPALLPREPYEISGRWTDYGDDIFTLRDRRGAEYLLAPTHEEMAALLVQDMTSSYRDFPLILFQVQTKFRDEPRPRAGLLRGREFLMKDAYSFDLSDAGLAAATARCARRTSGSSPARPDVHRSWPRCPARWAARRRRSSWRPRRSARTRSSRCTPADTRRTPRP